LNGGVNGGYGSINGGVRSRLASAGSPVTLPPEYATVRSHKIERSTSNPAVRQELSVCIDTLHELEIHISVNCGSITFLAQIFFNFI